MNVPEGTVLARAKRERWTQQIEAAKHAAALPQSNAITPMQSIAAVMQEREERYRERMADVSEKVAGHLESLDADEILSRSSQVEKIDTVARRTFGLDSPVAGPPFSAPQALPPEGAKSSLTAKCRRCTVRFIGICRCVGIRQIAGARSNFYLAVRVSGIPRQKSVDS